MESNDVAETDAARLVGAELDKSDLVGGHQNPAALLRGEREDGRPPSLRRPAPPPGRARPRSAVASVSTTSSRGMDWMPILTSTADLLCARPGHGLCAVSGFLSVVRGQPLMPRQASRATSCSAASLGMASSRAQPVPGADLGHAQQPDGQQVGLVVGQAGVLLDHLADQVGAHPVRRLGRLRGRPGRWSSPTRRRA